MRLRIIIFGIIAAFPNLGALPANAQTRKADVTYTKDVAPILYKHCAVCHHANDIAPMSLVTYKEVRPWAMAIREKVVQRVMPPWHADSNIGRFSNDARLSEAEIETIRGWVSSGAKEGDAKDMPPLPTFQQGWHIKPDVVLTIPEYVIGGASQDDYQYFYVPTNFTEDRWIQAAEVLPGDRRVVHHADVFVMDANEASGLRERLSRPGSGNNKYQYRTGNLRHIRAEAPVVDDGCSNPDGGAAPGQPSGRQRAEAAIYLPGSVGESWPPGYALKIPAGAYLVFQIHYNNRSGEDIRDQTSIGLTFATESVRYQIADYDVENLMFQIPPNNPNHRVTSCFVLPKEVTVVALTAHMHYRGKSMMTEVVYPDGHRKVLFNVPQYDFRWQERYYLKDPLPLPKGTKLVTTAYFDNSANNPMNPDPSKTVRYGEPSNEEMMTLFLHFAEPLVDSKAALAAISH